MILSVSNLVLIVLSAAAILAVLISSIKYGRKRDAVKRNFLDKEQAVNAVRKKEIDPELFYTPDLASFPPVSDDDPHRVKRAAVRTMVRLPQGMTNLELKSKFGLAQIETISLYEENFNEYLKALTNWASAIIAENSKENQADAVNLLTTVVEMGGEFRDAYKLLADIYASQNSKDELKQLFNQASENHFKDPSVKQVVLDYITSKE